MTFKPPKTISEAIRRWPGASEYQMAEDGHWWITVSSPVQIAVVLPCDVCGLVWCRT